MTTFIHLTQSRPRHELSGLINYYGCYDLSRPPQARLYDGGLVMTVPIMIKFVEAYCPGRSTEDLKDPAISPLYHDFRGIRLPSSIFVCGTDDALYDDTAFMHTKWAMAGGDARTKFFAGVPHGFMSFPGSMMPPRDEGLKYTVDFIKEVVKA